MCGDGDAQGIRVAVSGIPHSLWPGINDELSGIGVGADHYIQAASWQSSGLYEGIYRHQLVECRYPSRSQ